MAAWRYEIYLLVLKKRFEEKRNFVSPRRHVISSISSMYFGYRDEKPSGIRTNSEAYWHDLDSAHI